MKTVNLHTHLPLGENQTGLIYHPVELDFQPLSGQLYSAGIHPWIIAEQNMDELLGLINQLANHPQVIAIGECGLDRSIKTDMELQKYIFMRQVEIGETNNKPLIIHAVRSHAELLQLKKNRQSKIPWILHGYRGNKGTTLQLIRQDFYFSIGTSVLSDSEKLNQTLMVIPNDRLFFETDESKANIESIYIFAASILGLSPNELQSIVFKNFQRIFS